MGGTLTLTRTLNPDPNPNLNPNPNPNLNPNQPRHGEYDPARAEWAPAAARPDDLTFTTFSQGLHRCPGERLAVPLMQCVLGLLHGGAYETTLDGPPPPVDFERATLAQRAGPVPVRVRRV